MKNCEYKVLNSLACFLTKEQVQEEAQNTIDRNLTRDEMEEFKFKISEEMMWILQEAIQEVSDFTDLKRRSLGKKKITHRYEIFWKNENAYQNDFKFCIAFKDEGDARYYTRESFTSPGEEFKIEEINGDVMKTIVHHKNSLNGGDGFHMDVHEKPKDAQNRHEQIF